MSLKSPVIDVHLFWHQRYPMDLAHAWLHKPAHEMVRKDKVV
ncbi:hypothetical protein [Hylemonella gracilis]|nr:hypothetical protein [Hylemonella gracilis]